MDGGGNWAYFGPRAAVRYAMNGTEPCPSMLIAHAAHELWRRQMLEDGWQPGKSFSAEARIHDAIVPFEELPEEKRRDVEFEVVASGVLDVLAARDLHPRGAGATLVPSTVMAGLRVTFDGEPPSEGVVIGCAVDPQRGWPNMVYVRWADGSESMHPLGAGELKIAPRAD